MTAPLSGFSELSLDGNNAGPDGRDRQVRACGENQRPISLPAYMNRTGKNYYPSSASSDQEPSRAVVLFLNDKSTYCAEAENKLFEGQ